MLRSLSTAVSGLRNHQTKLDAIGNNIANVNTVAYKSSQVRFQDIFSQTLRGATAPQGGRGGVNPMQIGLGMEVASINTLHTPGAITGTGRETDLAIGGNGFFVVSDGFQQYYTRDGTFTRDSSGILVNAGGFQLLGWVIEDGEEAKLSETLGEIHIPLGEEMIARATGKISFSGNLDAAAPDTADSKCEYDTYVFDSLGNRHALTFTFEKAADNQWTYTINSTDSGISITDNTGTIQFKMNGRYDDDSNTPQFFISPGTGAEELKITPDFSAFTQLAFPSSVSLREQDGFPPGELATFNIESTGVITGTYSNGLVRPLGQLALASFANPEGLLKKGANLYELSSNSVEPRLGLPGTEGRGLIRSRSLEMSNVDLSLEFTEMITTSRAFQANTRVITTSDEVLLELINIKR